MRLFGRDADFKASWGFSPKLEGLSKKNFSREGSSSFNSGFVLDPEVINRKFYEYAAALEKASDNMKGEIDYFEPEERDNSLTDLADEMDVKSKIPHILNGNWEQRDSIADEILAAIKEKPRKTEVSSREEIDYIATKYAVLSADIVFEKEGEAANLRFESAETESYLAENSKTSRRNPFELKVYGENEFRKELTRRIPDLAGKWSDWDLARNKLKDSFTGSGIFTGSSSP